MGMFDSIWIKFKCPRCEKENPREEIQTKLGACQLESWTIGDDTTIRQGVYIIDHTPWCCSLETQPDIKMGGVYVNGKPHKFKDDSLTVHFRLTVGYHKVIEKLEMLKPCPKCNGDKVLNKKELVEDWKRVFRTPGVSVKGPEVKPVPCDACSGNGYLDEVVAVMEKVDSKPAQE